MADNLAPRKYANLRVFPVHFLKEKGFIGIRLFFVEIYCIFRFSMDKGDFFTTGKTNHSVCSSKHSQH